MTINENYKRKYIAKKSKIGLIFLTIKSLITNILQFASSIILARLLTPYDYGVFGILSSWINSLFYFTDIGLHESLVQQSEKITDKQIRSYLTVRVALSLLASLFFGICFIFLKSYFDIDTKFIGLYFLGLLSLFDACSSIPRLRLQKNLNFYTLSKIELLSTVLLYICQITSAFLGFAYWSFFIGIAVRHITIISYGFWRNMYYWPSIDSLSSIINNLKKGVYYQINLILVALGAILMPIILKYYLSVDTIGLYYWVNALISIPIVFINNYCNVLFPATAKLQNLEEQVKILTTRSGELLIFLIGIIFGLGSALGPAAIDILFIDKWFSAKVLVAPISFAVALFCTRNILNTLLSGMGKPRLRSRIEFFNLFLLLGLTIILTKYFLLTGFIYALIITHLISLIVATIACRHYIGPGLYKRFFLVFATAIFANLIIYNFNLQNNLLIGLTCFLLIFFPICLIIDKTIYDDIKQILSRFKTQQDS